MTYYSNKSKLSGKERISLLFPLIIAMALAIGATIGASIGGKGKAQYVVYDGGKGVRMPSGHVEEVLRFVEARYLEKPEQTELEDAAIRAVIKELDPHSKYISSKVLKGVNENLQGRNIWTSTISDKSKRFRRGIAVSK